eukprot:464637_1
MSTKLRKWFESVNKILSNTHNKILTKVIIEIIIEFIPRLQFDTFNPETSFVDEDCQLEPVTASVMRRLYACSYPMSDGVYKWKFKCLNNGGNGGIGIISNINGIVSGRDTTLWGSSHIKYSYFWGSGDGLYCYEKGTQKWTGSTKKSRNKNSVICVELNFDKKKLVFYNNGKQCGQISIKDNSIYYPAIETNENCSILQFLGDCE